MSAIAGAPAVPGAVMDQATERLICEVIEIVCEALPAAIIQVILRLCVNCVFVCV
jgi:hypothetical protein